MPAKSDKNEQRSEIKRIDLHNPAYYINRELSWIAFNQRVLEEAEDPTNPLLERLKFLAIFSSNLDEFFMIRVAGLKEQLDAGVVNLAADEMSVAEQLRHIREQLLPLIAKQSQLLQELLPQLADAGVVIHPYDKLPARDRSQLEAYFYQTVFPLLTPLAIDSGHPFPQVLNRSLNILFTIQSPDDSTERRAAVLQLPQVLSRFVPIQRKQGHHFVLMEEVIQAHSEALFPGLHVVESYCFRVSRDADIEIAEDEAGDLLTEMEEQVRKRHWGAAVRLELDERTPESLRELLMTLLDLTHDDVYAIRGPSNISDFMSLTNLDVRHARYPSFSSRVLARFHGDASNPAALFASIRQQDLIVHHPFDSFSNHVVKFAMAAATDPAVLAIKVTLYRAGRKSPVVDALIKAAQNAKQVTAFVELKARFDEENNIQWARELEAAGVHVVYGLVGLKTHVKIMMVVRKDEDRIRTYVHLSTGNYNQVTARIYTDIGYFTARDEFGTDAINLFNFLTGYSQYRTWKQFAVAPITLSDALLMLIRRETESHTPDNPGEIVAKLNALVDDTIIRALYRASQKGVRIKLLVRGICCLRPGVPGVSENIEVRSIVGRFLEHSRIIYFRNGGNEEIYLSSADWMPRNLYRRVEVMFPVPDPQAKAYMKHILNVYWADTAKSRMLLPDGRYEKLIHRLNITQTQPHQAFSAQQHFLNELRLQVKNTTGASAGDIQSLPFSPTLFIDEQRPHRGSSSARENGGIHHYPRTTVSTPSEDTGIEK
ncbi:MAG: polyphosphate kinase 1 [Bacteroidota bacterium]|nr:polyphosphate kinase 1 [Candidatus Kapabacteria bacterium]MDW8219697.1 polyphosphate kinase 1 [Bacteroidota bacterium]